MCQVLYTNAIEFSQQLSVRWSYLYFIDKETKAKEAKVTCLSPHNKKVVEWELWCHWIIAGNNQNTALLPLKSKAAALHAAPAHLSVATCTVSNSGKH